MNIPHGPDHLYCPFWRQKMSKVCHTCPMWQMLRGVHPQTGEPIPDEWNCALAHSTKLMIENSQQQRQTGAAVESFRNEMVEANRLSIALMAKDQKLIQ